MAEIAAIVEAALKAQGITLLTPELSRWKAVHRDEVARGTEILAVGWRRVSA